MYVKLIGWLARVRPDVCAAIACWVPPMIATLVREIHPTYSCNIRHYDYQTEGICVGVFALIAYGLGRVADKSAGPRKTQDKNSFVEKDGPDFEQIHAQVIAIIMGLALGIIPAVFIGNPCP